MKVFAILAIFVLAAHTVGGQTPAKPAFEAASVKAMGPERPDGSGLHSTGMAPPIIGDPAQVSLSNVSLVGVLCRAYDLKPLRITAPDWMRTERYTIAAKAPADAPKGKIPEMLQNLLTERFQMKVHWETNEEQGYALLVGKSPPSLIKSPPGENGGPPPRSSSTLSSGHLEWDGATLDDFATSLSVLTGRPVVDMTDLQGYFDITLDAAPDSMPGLPRGRAAAADSPNPPISAAIKSLGLTLEPRKVSVKRLVVDSALKVPTEN